MFFCGYTGSFFLDWLLLCLQFLGYGFQETRNKKRETRNKKQETRNEKQETRNKKQETRNEKQET
ncbi:hypothetical protein B0A58_15505, partial [Flavobacterium branchiophilum NBRC 15030 = ATCC 35035]